MLEYLLIITLLFINYRIKKHNNVAIYYFFYKDMYINVISDLIAYCLF